MIDRACAYFLPDAATPRVRSFTCQLGEVHSICNMIYILGGVLDVVGLLMIWRWYWLGYVSMPLPSHLYIVVVTTIATGNSHSFILIPSGANTFDYLQWSLRTVGSHALMDQLHCKVYFSRFLYPPELYLPLLFRHISWKRNNRESLVQVQEGRSLVVVLWGPLYWFCKSPLSMDISILNRLEPVAYSLKAGVENIICQFLTLQAHFIQRILTMTMDLYWVIIWLKSRISTLDL